MDMNRHWRITGPTEILIAALFALGGAVLGWSLCSWLGTKGAAAVGAAIVLILALSETYFQPTLRELRGLVKSSALKDEEADRLVVVIRFRKEIMGRRWCWCFIAKITSVLLLGVASALSIDMGSILLAIAFAAVASCVPLLILMSLDSKEVENYKDHLDFLERDMAARQKRRDRIESNQ